MLAVVKKPRIEIRAKHIPAPLVRFLKDTYKPEMWRSAKTRTQNGRRAVSRKMAVKLGEIFGTDPAALFDFSK